jgi:hypothetical protein
VKWSKRIISRNSNSIDQKQQPRKCFFFFLFFFSISMSNVRVFFLKNKKYRNTNHKAGGVCVCTKQWVRVVADGRAKTQTQSGKTTGRHTKDQKKNTNLNRNQIIIQKFRQIKTLKKKEIFFFVFYSPFCFGDVFFCVCFLKRRAFTSWRSGE